jgi:hypothetical protein
MVVQAKMGALKTWVLILLSLDSDNALSTRSMPPCYLAESEVAGGYEIMTNEWGPPLETI